MGNLTKTIIQPFRFPRTLMFRVMPSISLANQNRLVGSVGSCRCAFPGRLQYLNFFYCQFFNAWQIFLFSVCNQGCISIEIPTFWPFISKISTSVLEYHHFQNAGGRINHVSVLLLLILKKNALVHFKADTMQAAWNWNRPSHRPQIFRLHAVLLKPGLRRSFGFPVCNQSEFHPIIGLRKLSLFFYYNLDRRSKSSHAFIYGIIQNL